MKTKKEKKMTKTKKTLGKLFRKRMGINPTLHQLLIKRLNG